MESKRKQCEWLGHKWKNEGEPQIVGDLMTQGQCCAACGESRGYVEGLTLDQPSKLSTLFWKRIVPALMLVGFLWGVVWRQN